MHEASATFVSRLVQVAMLGAFGPSAREAAGWGAVCLAGRTADAMELAVARSRLLALGLDPDALDPESAPPGLFEVIAPGRDAPTLLAGIRSCRTVHEEVRRLEASLVTGALPEVLPILESYAGWSRLRAQLAREPERRRVHFVDRPVAACPKCRIKLLQHQESELKRNGVAEADCHGFILARNG